MQGNNETRNFQAAMQRMQENKEEKLTAPRDQSPVEQAIDRLVRMVDRATNEGELLAKQLAPISCPVPCGEPTKDHVVGGSICPIEASLEHIAEHVTRISDNLRHMREALRI